jgi:alpha-aminoadipate carrier protein LysW
MATCPVCEGTFYVDEEEVEEGDLISCEECGAELEVVSTDPFELEMVEDEDEKEDEEEEEMEM